MVRSVIFLTTKANGLVKQKVSENYNQNTNVRINKEQTRERDKETKDGRDIKVATEIVIFAKVFENAVVVCETNN